MRRNGILATWADYLPITAKTPALSLGEGNTPLVRAPTLAQDIGCDELWLKYEGMNPTGSFKDRGMVVAVAKAKEEGAKAVACASTGNTSASAAAYAAAAGMACRVVVPDGKVALGKMSQAVAHGAKIVVIRGNFDAALTAVRQLSPKLGMSLVNSVNPFRLEGQKTSAFEICEALGAAPDGLALPVGNAGNISAYWKGFVEWEKAGQVKSRPVLYGIQAAGAAPFIKGAPIAEPETIATAIRIGNPASWDLAVAAQRESKGLFDSVTDEEILAAYRRLAQEAGVFCEPASATPVAGLLKLSRAQPGRFKGQRLVAVLTGHGLKDPQTAIGQAPPLAPSVPNQTQALMEALS